MSKTGKLDLAKRGIDLGTPLLTRKGRELLGSLGLEAVDQLIPVTDAARANKGAHRLLQ